VLGKGTTFTISLPLTLAIIDGLIVTIGEQRFILPTLSVRESFRPTREMITTVHEKGEMVNVRGRLSPLLRMYEFYDVKPRTTDPTEALLVVVDNGGETRCLMVDQLIGKQEVVIKSLGETFKQAPAIAGGAILGDGRVGLIIDANSLVSLTARRRVTSHPAPPGSLSWRLWRSRRVSSRRTPSCIAAAATSLAGSTGATVARMDRSTSARPSACLATRFSSA
jgi:chemotaxis protein histidine kinase CheA